MIHRAVLFFVKESGYKVQSKKRKINRENEIVSENELVTFRLGNQQQHNRKTQGRKSTLYPRSNKPTRGIGLLYISRGERKGMWVLQYIPVCLLAWFRYSEDWLGIYIVEREHVAVAQLEKLTRKLYSRRVVRRVRRPSRKPNTPVEKSQIKERKPCWDLLYLVLILNSNLPFRVGHYLRRICWYL